MKRIQRASDKEEIIKLLMADQLGIFREIWRLMLFAAQVGFRNGRREPLKSFDSGKGIDQSTFGNCPAWPGLLYLTALVEAGRSDILAGAMDREDERIAIFQEYSNGGLSILQDYFKDRPIDLDGFLSFLETQTVQRTDEPDLDLSI